MITKIELMSRIERNEILMRRIQKVIDEKKEMKDKYFDVCIFLIDNLVSWEEIQEICKNRESQNDFYLECINKIISNNLVRQNEQFYK
jgi:hypothetical protein